MLSRAFKVLVGLSGPQWPHRSLYLCHYDRLASICALADAAQAAVALEVAAVCDKAQGLAIWLKLHAQIMWRVLELCMA